LQVAVAISAERMEMTNQMRIPMDLAIRPLHQWKSFTISL
jgi:hypothetical protein